MKLSELIKELTDFRLNLSAEFGNGPESDPDVILSSDEEGNSFHGVYEVTSEVDGIFIWPGGYELDL